jgi:hypothetical protein
MIFKDKRISVQDFGIKSILTLLLIVTALSGSAQITNGTINPEEDKTKAEKKEKKEKTENTGTFSEDSLTGSDFYIGGLFQYTYRSFEDQSVSNFYREWEPQTSSWNGGFNTGLIMKLTEHFHLDIGFSYYGTGENYFFEDSLTDSTFTYRNTYRQMALPVRLRFSYGNTWQVFGFAGIAPLNILSIRTTSSYRTAAGAEMNPVFEVEKDGFATFNLMTSVGFGVQYNIRHVGFTLYPEYRRNLMNTYSTKTIPMDHKMYGIGINAAMVFRF